MGWGRCKNPRICIGAGLLERCVEGCAAGWGVWEARGAGMAPAGVCLQVACCSAAFWMKVAIGVLRGLTGHTAQQRLLPHGRHTACSWHHFGPE